jgi:DNA modification methylase
VSIRFLIGDCREKLRELPSESVHCVVTSPPYLGLRDYGTAQWEGGDPACNHVQGTLVSQKNGLRGRAGPYPGEKAVSTGMPFRSVCGKCGARRIDSQIGLEATPAAYVAELVAVFREVRRVLRSDGTVWLNIGDSYAGYHGNKNSEVPTSATNGWTNGTDENKRTSTANRNGLKPKDLIGVPWRLAFALQDDGWWLRQDIIWAKPNPMPESVTDRCTKSHEYIFLLTKSASYAYDAQALAEPSADPEGSAARYKLAFTGNNSAIDRKQTGQPQGIKEFNGTRNRRSVWTIATAPFSEAHFATFPPELPELCIRAGTSERGCCPHCGKGWVRVTEYGRVLSTGGSDTGARATNLSTVSPRGETKPSSSYVTGNMVQREKITTGWLPSCSCPSHEPVPATVLDPFGGAGTTGLVADRLGRNAILIELNPEYAAMARTRLEADAGMFACLEAAE